MVEGAERGSAFDGPVAGPDVADSNERDLGELTEELRTVESYLRDLPPHAASGTRERLEEQRHRLQERIARVRAARG